MSQLFANINGAFVAEQEARILISDLAIQRGYGIFDFFRTVNGRPVFFDDHLERFYRSAAFMNLPVAQSPADMKQLILSLIAKNQLTESGVRLTLTGGYSENGFTPATPNLLITQTPFQFNTAAFDQGIHLITHEFQRQLPQVKTIDYLQAIYLQPAIKAQAADDVLYHYQGSLRECPRANFFIVSAKGDVLTPAHNILHGVTRKKILGLNGFRILEADVRLSDLAGASEAFITSSTKEVLPVVKVDGRPVGDGRPGKVTAAIYRQLLAARDAAL